MSEPALGGRVLDGSFVAALTRGSIAATAWIETARLLGSTLLLPSLAVAEVQAVRPDAGRALAELRVSPVVLLAELDAPTADQVDQALDDAGVWDALAGHVTTASRARGWPVLTADPGRLARIDPDVAYDLI